MAELNVRRQLQVTASDLRDLAATWSRGDLRRKAGTEIAVRRLLVGGVFPLWLGAGLADWYLHRRTKIEETPGPRESLIHHLMFAETGAPVMLGLFCEVNAGVLATAYGAVGLHTLTALWDQYYAEPRRRVSPLEQHVHSFLEVSPVMAAFLLTGLYWDQARALAARISVRPGSPCGSSGVTRCPAGPAFCCSARSLCSAPCLTPRSFTAAGERSPRPPRCLNRPAGRRRRWRPPTASPRARAGVGRFNGIPELLYGRPEHPGYQPQTG